MPMLHGRSWVFLASALYMSHYERPFGERSNLRHIAEGGLTDYVSFPLTSAASGAKFKNHDEVHFGRKRGSFLREHAGGVARAGRARPLLQISLGASASQSLRKYAQHRFR